MSMGACAQAAGQRHGSSPATAPGSQARGRQQGQQASKQPAAHLRALVAVQAVNVVAQRLGARLGLLHQHQRHGDQRALLHKVNRVPADCTAGGQGRVGGAAVRRRQREVVAQALLRVHRVPAGSRAGAGQGSGSGGQPGARARPLPCPAGPPCHSLVASLHSTHCCHSTPAPASHPCSLDQRLQHRHRLAQARARARQAHRHRRAVAAACGARWGGVGWEQCCCADLQTLQAGCDGLRQPCSAPQLAPSPPLLPPARRCRPGGQAPGARRQQPLPAGEAPTYRTCGL